jgi:hypothetical protein
MSLHKIKHADNRHEVAEGILYGITVFAVVYAICFFAYVFAPGAGC